MVHDASPVPSIPEGHNMRQVLWATQPTATWCFRHTENAYLSIASVKRLCSSSDHFSRCLVILYGFRVGGGSLISERGASCPESTPCRVSQLSASLSRYPWRYASSERVRARPYTASSGDVLGQKAGIRMDRKNARQLRGGVPSPCQRGKIFSKSDCDTSAHICPDYSDLPYPG